MTPLAFFGLILRASLLSTGGLGNVPQVHHEMIGRGWAMERQFAEALAVGQIAPGPNGLWVISLGYLTDGLRGASLAFLAICLPPLLVLGVNRVYARVRELPATAGFVRGLSLSVAGVFAVVLAGLLRRVGFDTHSVLIALVSIALTLTRRVPVPLIVGLAALAGILLR